MKKTLGQRFWEKVKVPEVDACWIWTSAFTTNGYGFFWVGGEKRSEYAHRVAYYLTKGDIGKGLMVMHSCDNPACVNPSHLSIGTASDNTIDSVQKGRARCCKQNGEMNTANKLTQKHVQTIRLLDGVISDGKLAKIYGVTRECVRDTRSGKMWKHIRGTRQALSPSPQYPNNLAA